jgi:ribosome recycling factor
MGGDPQKLMDEKAAKSIAVLRENLNTVRAGRANPALLDKIMVDYYGVPTPLKNMRASPRPIRGACSSRLSTPSRCTA